MDESLPAAELAEIERTLRCDTRLLGFHRLRTRKSGGDRQVDVHIVLPGELTLAEAHRIAVELEQAIGALFPRTHVVTHVDPHTVVPGAGAGSVQLP